MTATWLKRLGACSSCRKKADGILMDERNGQIGPYCEKCATKRIADEKTAAAEYREFKAKALRA